MNLVITDSGLGGLSVCAHLASLLKEETKNSSRSFPAEKLRIIYVNAVPSDERGYNSMSGKTEQIQTFDRILRNTEKLFSPEYIFVACGSLSVLLPGLPFFQEGTVSIEGIVSSGIRMITEKIKQNPQAAVIIFATPTTISAQTFQKALAQNGVPEKQILPQACPDLATQISNTPEDVQIAKHIRHWVQAALQKLPENSEAPLIAFLICTHYGYRENLFRKALSAEGYGNAVLLNPNFAAAKNLTQTILAKMPAGFADSLDFSVEFVTPYAIPEQEKHTLRQLLNPISTETSEAFENAKVCPELLVVN